MRPALRNCRSSAILPFVAVGVPIAPRRPTSHDNVNFSRSARLFMAPIVSRNSNGFDIGIQVAVCTANRQIAGVIMPEEPGAAFACLSTAILHKVGLIVCPDKRYKSSLYIDVVDTRDDDQ